MDYQTLHAKTVVELRRLAKEIQVRIPSGVNKTEIIHRLLEAQKDGKEAEPSSVDRRGSDKDSPKSGVHGEKGGIASQSEKDVMSVEPLALNDREERKIDSIPVEIPQKERGKRGSFPLKSGLPIPEKRQNFVYRMKVESSRRAGEGSAGEPYADGSGILEILGEGYGILRAENCQPGKGDIYISMAQIRKFNLRMGDRVEGKTRPQREGDRYGGMIYITRINGAPPEALRVRRSFESLVPVYPMERLRMETSRQPDLSMRIMDIIAPVGKGQRALIVSQPKAGKTTLLKKIANAISENNPEVELIVLLIDERPEEVTDMKRSIRGDVIYSTFDQTPENHARVAELLLERVQRLVEAGRDVVVLLDSITRLARAYNLVIPPTGRSLSGGLDPGALHKPKRFFGAARNIENGGSLTVIATALVETGSRMDDIIYEEFKGTGNMELHLDRRLSDRRIFPAIDLLRSGTRREELLMTPDELEGRDQIRAILNSGNAQQNAENLIGMMGKTEGNEEFFRRLKSWVRVYEKEGYSLGSRNV
ncbi:MAG: transcription termination factor Rho [Christensenellales bacterium]|nr:transcription termination factor Rho [Christensenellales bacterium]